MKNENFKVAFHRYVNGTSRYAKNTFHKTLYWCRYIHINTILISGTE